MKSFTRFLRTLSLVAVVAGITASAAGTAQACGYGATPQVVYVPVRPVYVQPAPVVRKVIVVHPAPVYRPACY